MFKIICRKNNVAAEINCDLNKLTSYKLQQIKQAITIKELNEGQQSPWSEEAFYDEKDREWYDKNNWFHYFPADWATMRDLYFRKELAETETQSGEVTVMMGMYNIKPTYLYEQLQGVALQSDHKTEQKKAKEMIHKISAAIDYFGKKAALQQRENPDLANGVDLDIAIRTGGFRELPTQINRFSLESAPAKIGYARPPLGDAIRNYSKDIDFRESGIESPSPEESLEIEKYEDHILDHAYDEDHMKTVEIFSEYIQWRKKQYQTRQEIIEQIKQK